MGDQRTIKRSRKEFRRLVEMNGGVEKFMEKPKKRGRFWPYAIGILVLMGITQIYAMWYIITVVWSK